MEKKRIIITWLLLFISISISTLVSCNVFGVFNNPKDPKAGNYEGPLATSAKEITSFSFSNPQASGIIDESAKTITITVPYNTSVSALIANFVSTGLSVKVIDAIQVSGSTPNDFTNPVSYVVMASDETTVTYTVTVSIASISTPPIVSSTVPSNNATNVALNSSIVATFSEAMDPLTITSSTFSVMEGTNVVTGNINDLGTSIIFTPTTTFSSSTQFTVMITTGVKDLNGNPLVSNKVWTFTTGAASDTTPPTISSIIPTDTSTNIAINSSITATFDKNLNASTVNASTFTLSQGSTSISGTVSCSGTTVTFTPLANLAYGTTYTVTITASVKDLSGNNLANAKTWVFSTVSQDTTPPTIISTSPVDNAINVAVDSKITVTFSEPIDASTISSSTFTLYQGATEIDASLGGISVSGNSAIFTSGSILSYNMLYTATITTEVKDLAGNTLATNKVWSFTIVPDPLSTTAAVVATVSVTNIGTEVATSGGNITSDGGALVTARGVCWSTNQNPTIADPHTTDSNGEGSYISSLIGLTSSTTYYLRAYATNSVGTSYGNQIAFTTSMKTYVVGDVGPAGGIIFYDKGIITDGWRYFEVAPTDQSVGIQWYNGSYITTEATATGMGSGKANTETIISKHGTGSYAASICDNLTLGGYDNWFLPSKDELNQMYVNLKQQNRGGFVSEWYWSSSENLNNTVWGQYFAGGGDQISHDKSSGYCVRAVHAFSGVPDITAPMLLSTLGAMPGNNQIHLNWINPTDIDLASIEVTWTPSGGSPSQPVTVQYPNTTQVISGLTNGTQYTFTLKSVDTSGNKSSAALATCTPITPPTNGLQAQYLFNGDAFDGSGNFNNGALSSPQLTSNRFGIQDKAYSFNGTSDYIDFGTNASLNPTSAVTVSAWISMTSYPPPGAQTSWVAIVDKRNSYILSINGTTGLVLTIYAGSSTWNGIIRNVAPQTDFALDQWYHVVGAYDSSDNSGYLYINNILQTSTGNYNGWPTVLLGSSDHLYIGAEEGLAWQYFPGKIDDVRIYSRKLTPAEIGSLYLVFE